MDARTIAAEALGRDPGPLTPVDSRSHHVYLGADVVVKLIAADDHNRMNREIVLAPHLPPDLTAPLLASGQLNDVRYACYTRVPRQALTTQTESLGQSRVRDGLQEIASRAPANARSTVPVHADCHWGNWLANGTELTALLDFEWARYGDPLDDWFFLARFSGPHMHAVLELIADTTKIPLDVLRVECEVREASHLIADLPFDRAGILELLEQLMAGIWWQ